MNVFYVVIILDWKFKKNKNHKNNFNFKISKLFLTKRHQKSTTWVNNNAKLMNINFEISDKIPGKLYYKKNLLKSSENWNKII